MKKVSFRLRNFDKEQFLTYNIDNEADLDEDVLNFLEDEEPEGIVPVIFDDSEEEYDTFSYDITDKIHLADLSNQEVNAEMVLMVMRGIVISLTNMAEYRIPISYLVLHRNYVYIDSDYKVEFICIPLEDMDEDADITGFLRGVVSNIRFDSSENGDYVAKLLTCINNAATFKLHNLLDLIEELMDDYGIAIPDDNETGIYVDYQEVEESEEAAAGEENEEEEAVLDETTVLSEGDADTKKADTDEAESEEPDTEESDTEESDTEETSDVQEEESVSEEELEEEGNIPEEPVSEETEQPEEISSDEEEALADIDDGQGVAKETLNEAKELIDRIKQQVLEEKENKKAQKEAEKEAVAEEEDSNLRTKNVTGVVIHDELDDYLAEKELEEMRANRDEAGIKMKKNIKVNRASIVNTMEEQAAAAEEEHSAEEEEDVSGSILSQTIGATGILRGAGAVPKANPYLIRVNTGERVMITKQTFKIGKASMGVDYTVKGNGAVSRVHAVITNKDDVYYIKDNKSTNHTYVNGKIVDEGREELLTHDSKIMLGDEEFIFKLR